MTGIVEGLVVFVLALALIFWCFTPAYPIGTKSVLYGAHCFFIHPWFVALAWWKLYGFPWDPRLWVAFIVHDWGYWGKPNMDGHLGETHPELGGRIMDALFGKSWGDFTRYHSRFYARLRNQPYSRLCVADKYSLVLMPEWLYFWQVNATGEIAEYMTHAVRGASGKYALEQLDHTDQRVWLASVKAYLRRWVEQEQQR